MDEPDEPTASRIATAAQLLKRTLEVLDYQTEPETMLDEVLARHRKLGHAVRGESLSIDPRAVYVGEP